MSLINVLIVLSPFALLLAMLSVWKQRDEWDLLAEQDREKWEQPDPITHPFTRRWLYWVVGLIIVVCLIGGLR
jgi:hypothetical protein